MNATLQKLITIYILGLHHTSFMSKLDSYTKNLQLNSFIYFSRNAILKQPFHSSNSTQFSAWWRSPFPNKIWMFGNVDKFSEVGQFENISALFFITYFETHWYTLYKNASLKLLDIIIYPNHKAL